MFAYTRNETDGSSAAAPCSPGACAGRRLVSCVSSCNPRRIAGNYTANPTNSAQRACSNSSSPSMLPLITSNGIRFSRIGKSRCLETPRPMRAHARGAAKTIYLLPRMFLSASGAGGGDVLGAVQTQSPFPARIVFRVRKGLTRTDLCSAFYGLGFRQGSALHPPRNRRFLGVSLSSRAFGRDFVHRSMGWVPLGSPLHPPRGRGFSPD